MSAGRFAQAKPIAERAIEGQQRCILAHGLLAEILVRLRRFDDATRVIVDAMALNAGSADAYDLLAYVSLSLRLHERAHALYELATQLSPWNARYWYNLASSHRAFGRLAESESACNRSVTLDPTNFPAHLLRSELRIQTPEANHAQELRSLLARCPGDDRARMFLGYALAKELDDLQRFDEAFHWSSEGARARRRHLAYDVATDERKLKRIAECFPRNSLQQAYPQARGSGHIFIVGLPRSGTTLVERILCGLPGVTSNGETDNFATALMETLAAGRGNGGDAAADVFERAAAADESEVARIYEQLAGNPLPCERIIEKLPMNYLYLGAIARALPQAKLILVSRHPLDSCFAMYRTLFGEAYPFTYDFVELARYYAAYSQLVQHWRDALGSRLHEVAYEDLVQDPIAIGSRIADYCGIEWADTAVDVHRTHGVSMTASAAQVRRPIYDTSAGRWRHYRNHLKPLMEALCRLNI